MNYAPCLSTVCCCRCGDEHAPESLNENGHCLGCRVDLQMAVDAERALDFQALSAEALRDSTAAVVARAQARAKLLHSTVYSKAVGQ